MMRYTSLFLNALGYTAPYFLIEVLSGFVKLLVSAIGVGEGAIGSRYWATRSSFMAGTPKSLWLLF